MDPVSVVFGYFKFLKFSGKNRKNPQIRKQNSSWTVMLSQKKYYNKFGTYPKIWYSSPWVENGVTSDNKNHF